ncbi:hypothetical protein C8R45DRAFT_1162560 [Mycena sanguinolenta]|nr:hypothetical protein C8R45DRAFT_1162560 [Mycena sanguinolenta]
MAQYTSDFYEQLTPGDSEARSLLHAAMSSESSVATVAQEQAVHIDALRRTLQRVFAASRFPAVNPDGSLSRTPMSRPYFEAPNAVVFAPNFLLGTDAQQHIISHCAVSFGPHVVPHPFRPATRLFVKRGNPSLVDEARTQAYLYQHARSSSTAPSMAEVYETFCGHGSMYLVMEHIDAVSFRVWIEASADEQEREERSATAVVAITEEDIQSGGI